jgi:hypothetical protein
VGTYNNLVGMWIIGLAVCVWLAYLWIAFKLYGRFRPRRWVYWSFYLVPIGVSLWLDWGFGLAVGAIGICVWWGFLPMERFIFGADSDAQRLPTHAQHIGSPHRGESGGRLDGSTVEAGQNPTGTGIPARGDFRESSSMANTRRAPVESVTFRLPTRDDRACCRESCFEHVKRNAPAPPPSRTRSASSQLAAIASPMEWR